LRETEIEFMLHPVPPGRAVLIRVAGRAELTLTAEVDTTAVVMRVVEVPQAICPVVADTSAAVVLAVAEDTQAAAVTANAGSVS
jgi:hypothetical protein